MLYDGDINIAPLPATQKTTRDDFLTTSVITLVVKYIWRPRESHLESLHITYSTDVFTLQRQAYRVIVQVEPRLAAASDLVTVIVTKMVTSTVHVVTVVETCRVGGGQGLEFNNFPTILCCL